MTWLKQIKKLDITHLLFILPAFLILVSLLIYPIFSSIIYSLTSKHLIRPDFEMIWLEEFKYVLTNPEFYKAFLSSIKWTFFSITGQVLVGFAAALAINRVISFRGMYKKSLIIRCS